MIKKIYDIMTFFFDKVVFVAYSHIALITVLSEVLDYLFINYLLTNILQQTDLKYCLFKRLFISCLCNQRLTPFISPLNGNLNFEIDEIIHYQ